MQLKVFLATLWRRWYLLLAALVITAVATVLVVVKVGPTYQAEGSVLLFPPKTTTQRGSQTETVGNPYLMLSGLTLARDIVIRSLTSQATYDQLCQPRPEPAYEVMRSGLCSSPATVTFEATPDYTNSAPIILFKVQASTPESALTALDAAMDRVPAALGDLQKGLELRANNTITSVPLTADTKPEPVYKNQIRAGIVAAAVTMAVFLLMIGLADALLAFRRARMTGGRRAQVQLDDLEEAEPAPSWDVPDVRKTEPAARSVHIVRT